MPSNAQASGRQPLRETGSNTAVTTQHFEKQKAIDSGMTAGLENPYPVALPTGTSTKSTTLTASGSATKRKAGAYEDDAIDDDDPRLDILKWDCDQIRRKINNFINSGEMKIGEFQSVLGVTSRSYNTFLGQNGKMKGSGSNTYSNAHRFFAKRELQGIKDPKKKAATSKKAKLEAEQKFDVSGIHLDGEEEAAVEVYDTCDGVRRKIRTHLRDPDVTQASFLRDLAKTYPASMNKKFQAKSLTDFLSKSGPNAGNTGSVFYAAYVFFEKLRIRDGKPKTKFRQEMEDVWGHEGGFDRRTPSNVGYICHVDYYLYVDEYGRPRTARKF
jgi:hypothetical protein